MTKGSLCNSRCGATGVSDDGLRRATADIGVRAPGCSLRCKRTWPSVTTSSMVSRSPPFLPRRNPSLVPRSQSACRCVECGLARHVSAFAPRRNPSPSSFSADLSLLALPCSCSVLRPLALFRFFILYILMHSSRRRRQCHLEHAVH